MLRVLCCIRSCFNLDTPLRYPRPRSLTTTVSPRAAAQQFQHTNNHVYMKSPLERYQRNGRFRRCPRGTSYHLDEPLHTPPSGKGSYIGHNGLHTPPTVGAADVSSEAVHFICGFSVDDGFSIACDICSRWCHSACFGVDSSTLIPDSFVCWVCNPRLHYVKEMAIDLQRNRLDAGLLGASGLALGLALGRLADDGAKQRWWVSPGTDRKARRGAYNYGREWRTSKETTTAFRTPCCDMPYALRPILTHTANIDIVRESSHHASQLPRQHQ